MVRNHCKDLPTWPTATVNQAAGSATSAVWMLVGEAHRTLGTATNEAHSTFNGNERLGTLHGAKSVVSEPKCVASGSADRAQGALPPCGRSPRPVQP